MEENRRRRTLGEPRRHGHGACVDDRGNVIGEGPGRVIRGHAKRARRLVPGARVIDAMDDQQRLGGEQDGEQREHASTLPTGTNPCQQRPTCARSAHLARESTVLVQSLAERAATGIA